MDTIADLAFFVKRMRILSKDKIFQTFEKCVTRVKEAAFDFVKENVEALLTVEVGTSLPEAFFEAFIENLEAQQNKQIQGTSIKDSAEKVQAREKKRMEPVKDSVKEEKPILKKAKKYVWNGRL